MTFDLFGMLTFAVGFIAFGAQLGFAFAQTRIRRAERDAAFARSEIDEWRDVAESARSRCAELERENAKLRERMPVGAGAFRSAPLSAAPVDETQQAKERIRSMLEGQRDAFSASRERRFYRRDKRAIERADKVDAVRAMLKSHPFAPKGFEPSELVVTLYGEKLSNEQAAHLLAEARGET